MHTPDTNFENTILQTQRTLNTSISNILKSMPHFEDAIPTQFGILLPIAQANNGNTDKATRYSRVDLSTRGTQHHIA